MPRTKHGKKPTYDQVQPKAYEKKGLKQPRDLIEGTFSKGWLVITRNGEIFKIYLTSLLSAKYDEKLYRLKGVRGIIDGYMMTPTKKGQLYTLKQLHDDGVKLYMRRTKR